MTEENKNQREHLAEKKEEISDNYFRRVNKEYNKAMLTGQFDENTIQEIVKRNKTDFIDKVKDAFEDIDAAGEWLLKTITASFAGTWIGEIFGLKNKLDASYESIKETITNPISVLTGAIGGFSGFALLKKFGLNAANPLSLISKSGAIMRLGVKAGAMGAVFYGAVKLYEHFHNNPDDAKSMPSEKGALRKWWEEKMDYLGLTEEKEKLIALVMGEETAEELFPKEEKEKKKEDLPYETAPIPEALANYQDDLENAVAPLIEWGLEHKTAVGVGALYLSQFKALREAAKLGGAISLNLAIELAKIPFKAVNGFPLWTLFGVTALILHLEELGETEIPKDSKNLAIFLQAKAEKYSAWLLERDIPTMQKDQIGIAARIISGDDRLANYIDEAEEMIGHVVERGLDRSTLSPESIVHYTNIDNMRSFKVSLKTLANNAKETEEYPIYEELIKKLTSILERLKTGYKLTNSDIEELKAIGAKINIKICNQGKYVSWGLQNDNGFYLNGGPKDFCINPNLSLEFASDAAMRFASEDTAWNAAPKLLEVPINEVRLITGEILFENGEIDEYSTKILERRLKEGDQIMMSAGKAWLYQTARGVAHKYFLGPVQLLEHPLEALSGDFSAVELAVDYAEGIVPVMIMGATSRIARRDFKNFGFKSIFMETVLYPISGARRIISRGLISFNYLREGQLGAFVKSPAINISSRFWKYYHEKAYKMRSFVGVGTKIKTSHSNLGYLYEAKAYLNQGIWEGKNQRKYIEQANEALDNLRYVDEIGKVEDHTVSKRLKRIDEKIALEKKNIKEYKKGITTPTPEAERGSNEHSKPKSETEMRERAKQVEGVDKKLATAEEAYNRKKKKLLADGRPLRNKEKLKEIKELESNYKIKNETLMVERKSLVHGISKADLKKHNIESQRKVSKKFKFKTKSRLKGAAHGAAAIGAGIALGFGISYLKDDQIEDFDPKKVEEKFNSPLKRMSYKFLAEDYFDPETNEETRTSTRKKAEEILELNKEELDKFFPLDLLDETEDKKESRTQEEESNLTETEFEFNEEELVVQQMDDYFEALNTEHAETFSFLEPKTLENLSEEELKGHVEKSAIKHIEIVKQIKEFVKTNSKSIYKFFKEKPEKEKMMITNYIAMGYDKKKEISYIKYDDEKEFKRRLYTEADFMRRNMDEIIEGGELTTTDQIIDGAKYAVPVYGTYLDYNDAYNSFTRGDMTEGLASSFWGTVGAVGDVAIGLTVVTGVSGAVGGALKGIRVASAGGKIVKAVRASKTVNRLSKVSKVLKTSRIPGALIKGAIGADIGRALYKPNFSNTYYF